jgi:hypothetical protein
MAAPVAAPRPKVSVIIRTRNEESWVGHCLDLVFAQDYPDFEVIVVDNCSTDHTLQIVARYPVAKVVTIERYLPGLALNMGIAEAGGEMIACLSAHCVPQKTDWLTTLVAGLEDPGIAGVYGRQLPLAFSGAIDKRDLLTVFGLDRRIQTRDYFFHNANSLVRRSVLAQIPFDDALTNIEDRHWGKAVIAAGWRLLYEPEAAVYHHHGINQANDGERAGGVSHMLDLLDQDLATALPDCLKPENCNVAAVVPVLGEPRDLQGFDLLSALFRQLAEARYVRAVYVFSENARVQAMAERHGLGVIPRPAPLCARDRTLGDILQYVLAEIERGGNYPHTLLYANYLCPFRPSGLFDALISDLQYRGLDSVFPGYIDYNDHWINEAGRGFQRVTESRRPAPEQPALYRSLYGLGCATRAAVVRRGQLVGEKVGVLPIQDHIYTLRCSDHRPEPVLPARGAPASPIGWTAELFLREFRP